MKHTKLQKFFLSLFFTISLFFPFSRSQAREQVRLVKLEVALEEETVEEYPDYHRKVEEMVDYVNLLFKEAGIERKFIIDKIWEPYNREDYHLSEPQEVPPRFFSHENTSVFLAIDAMNKCESLVYFWYPSAIICGQPKEDRENDFYLEPYHALFSPKGWLVFAHDLAHTVGAEDLYFMNIAAEQNEVNGEKYINRYQKDLMSSLDIGYFSSYTAELINRASIPPEGLLWYNFFPEKNYLLIADKYGRPLENISVRVFSSGSRDRDWGSFYIDNEPEFSGQTDDKGKFFIGNQPLDKYYDQDRGVWSFGSVLLIEVELGNKYHYSWLEITQFNEAFWKGNKAKATFEIRTNFVGDLEDKNEDKDGFYEAAWVYQTQGTIGEFKAFRGKRGEKIEVEARFRNAGSAVWENEGEEMVGFYVYKDPIYSTPLIYNDPTSSFYGKSYFADQSWGPSFNGVVSHSQAAILNESKVFHNEIGSFNFVFYIPPDAKISQENDANNTPHREDFYREDLTLAYGATWMKNLLNGDPLGYAHVWFPIAVKD